MVNTVKIKIFLLCLFACEAVALGIWVAFGENYGIHLAVVAVLITLLARPKKDRSKGAKE